MRGASGKSVDTGSLSLNSNFLLSGSKVCVMTSHAFWRRTSAPFASVLCTVKCAIQSNYCVVWVSAYKIGSLKQCNEKLGKYGPENIKMDRISVKVKPHGQETAVSRQDVSICSFSGKNDSDCLPFVIEIKKTHMLDIKETY